MYENDQNEKIDGNEEDISTLPVSQSEPIDLSTRKPTSSTTAGSFQTSSNVSISTATATVEVISLLSDDESESSSSSPQDTNSKTTGSSDSSNDISPKSVKRNDGRNIICLD